MKLRGAAFDYLPPQKEIVDLGGFHLLSIPNGSFENGGSIPSGWTVRGSGTGQRYRLAGEPNEPQVSSRGQYDLRLVTGAAATADIHATSRTIVVDADTTYTTTGNLRFGWNGDPNPGGTPRTRPQIYIRINYFRSDGARSKLKAADTFRFFQENGAADFQTIPVQYSTPVDAASVKITVGAARNHLAQPIRLDVDNLR